MVDLNSNISVIALNMSGLSVPIKRQRLVIEKLKKQNSALAAVTQWIEHRPVNQRVAGWSPSQGTCLGCGPGPQYGACER